MSRIFFLIFILMFFYRCGEQEAQGYEDLDYINFRAYYYNSAGVAVYFDSTIFSFGKKLPEIQKDTAKIVVDFVGRASERVRTYRVSVVDSGEVVKGKTTMVESEDYEFIEPLQNFRPNAFSDTLRIVVSRKNLDPVSVHKASKTLILRLESSDDFAVGFKSTREMKLSVNDYLLEPVWWRENLVHLKFYHPEKWRLLISWDERFVVDDVQKVSLPEMITYGNVLASYLSDNVVIDQETNMRVYMDGLYPIE